MNLQHTVSNIFCSTGNPNKSSFVDNGQNIIFIHAFSLRVNLSNSIDSREIFDLFLYFKALSPTNLYHLVY